MKPRSQYEEFESSSTANRRLLRQEELIIEVTEALVQAMQRDGVSKTALAARLGKSKAFVSQVFGGGRNLTLRTVADIADALDCRVKVRVCKDRIRSRVTETYSGEKWPDAVERLPGTPKVEGSSFEMTNDFDGKMVA